jgi:probable HAF family extracellular repeat protein
MRRYALATLTAGLLLVPVLGPVGADAPLYKIEDLGTIDGFVPTITGVNASGDVSGFVSGNAGPRAVRYRAGHWSYVPGLESVMSVANGINDHGDLTGYHITAVGLRAFRFVDGDGGPDTLEDVEPLPGGSATIGMAINNNREVVGYGNTPDGNRGWRAPSGTQPTVLPILPGGSFAIACGVNDAGQVVGTADLADGTQHAVLISPNDAITDLESLDGPAGTSMACAIDASGRVAGRSSFGADTHAFRYNGAIADIDAFASTTSSAESTNNGVTVGTFTAPDGLHAFVHTAADGAVDLNTRIPSDSGWFLSQARAVNASGQIAGQGLVGSEPHAFLLTPTIPPDTTPPTITSLVATPSSIVPPNKLMVPVALTVTATDERDPAPTCLLSGINGNGAPASDFAITGVLSGSVRATGGATYSFVVTCNDATGNSVDGMVNVIVPPDRTPPVISSVKVTPSPIWPPNNAMVTITVSATATDDSGETPTCKLGNITSPGAPAGDFVVTGANTGSVRAVGGRTYTVNAICTDGSGNYSWGSANVTVPPDTTAPTIKSLSVSPSTITPPNFALVPVTVSVTAVDDVDASPACFLASITSPDSTADDASVTGTLSGRVRAVGGRTYSLKVTCMDSAANQRSGYVSVVVPPDRTAPVITRLSVTPSVVWPANHKMVDVVVAVSATDDVDGVVSTCGITSITASEPAADDAVVTGATTASVRAERDSDGSARIYTLHVTCSDRAGNTAEGTVDVTINKSPLSTLMAKRNRYLLAKHAWQWLLKGKEHNRR